MHALLGKGYRGPLIIEREMPYGQMWADDRIWYPLILQGRYFEGRFLFDEGNLVGCEMDIEGARAGVTQRAADDPYLTVPKTATVTPDNYEGPGAAASKVAKEKSE